MKQNLKSLTLVNQEELIEKLIQSGIAFAHWRMPNEDDTHLIICIEGARHIADANLSELGKGFVINKFSNNHPIAPIYLNADLVVEKDSIDIDPTLNDEKIDHFLRAINNSGNKSKYHKIESHDLNDNSLSILYQQLVGSAIEKIKSDQFEKIVLSRFEDAHIPEGFTVLNYFNLLVKNYPNAFCSLTYIPNQGLWVGASPELLISNDKERFKTVALAGTKNLDNNQELSEIAWTQKEIEEQAFVSRYIINCFKKLRLREFHEHGPKTTKAGHLAHLKTFFEVKYNEVDFDGLADQMLKLLHPTSAVCGMPIEKTEEWIAEHEEYDREYYAGFLGPVNYLGSTDLFVNLRCAKIHNGIIRFYAGAGITEDSHPEKEFIETEMKMNILKQLLG